MPQTKTTIDSSLGVVSQETASAGSFEITTPVSMSQNASNSGMAPYLLAPTILTTGSTLTFGQPGVVTIAGTAPSVIVMPLAASCPGAFFTVRTTTAFAHFLTGSAEANTKRVFTDGTSSGSRLTLAATVGSSVVMQSDGINFVVLGNSGSLSIGTP